MSQIINVGATANDGTGDPLRDAFIKVNENFASIDALLSGTDVLTISQITGLQTALNNIQTQLDYIPGLQGDINSINLTIFAINQTLISQNSSIADLYDEITNLQAQIFTKIEEAPIDGLTYGRKDGAWIEVISGIGATPSFQEVLQVNNVSNIGFQLNAGATVSNLSPNILDFANLTGYTTLDANGIQFQTQGVLPSKIASMSPDGIRFRLGANDVQLLYNPAQTVSANFFFPLRNTFGNYTLATTLDYTLNNVLTVGATTSLTAGFLSGTRRTNINHTGLEVLDTGGNQMTTKIESDVIRFTRFGNNITLSALAAAGGSFNVDFILPTKSPGTYTLATLNDLYTISQLNANTLNIITSGSGTTVNRALNVRGLTSSNGTISISGTGSNTSTNWAWDLRSLNGLPVGGSAGQILVKNSSTNYDASWVNNPTSGFVPYTGANNNVNLGTYSLTSAKGLYQFTDNNNQFYVERNDYGYNRLYFNTIDTSDDDFGAVNVTINPEESINLSKSKSSSSELGYLIVAQNIIDATVQSPDYYHYFRMNGGNIDFFVEDSNTSVSNNIYFTPSRSVFSKQTELPKVLFNSITEPSEAQALTWNDTQGTMNIGLKGGQTVVKSGVDLVVRIVNKVTPNTTLTKAAYQAVRISGAQGQRLAVQLARANDDNNSADTIGLVCETIATNQEGYIMTVGQLEGVNTTGSLQGETWVDGDVLYLSPTTAGRLTNVKPTGATGHIVVMGYVEYAHVNNGKIYVKIMNGWELDELHNVNIVGATSGQVLRYDGTNWINATVGVPTDLYQFNTKQGFYFFEDFLGHPATSSINTLTLGTIATGTGSICLPTTTYPNRTNQQGVMVMGSGTLATGVVHIRLGDNNAGSHYLSSGPYTLQYSVNIETLSDATNRFFNLFGTTTSVNFTNPAGLLFIYDEGGASGSFGAASPNWKCVTRNGVSTVTTTSIPVVAGQWYVLKIVTNANGTSVQYFINDVLVATHTTNIPSLATPRIVHQKTAGTTNRNVFVDYMLAQQIYTNPRTI